MGDFNEIRTLKERMWQQVYDHGGPSEFIDATNPANIMELPSIGGNFTQLNNSAGPHFTQRKLDKAFVNEELLDILHVA